MAIKRPPTADELVAMDPTQALTLKLSEVRASRALAEKKGALTNVPALHRTELEILRAISLSRQATTDPMTTMSEADVVALILAALPTLPSSALKEIREALSPQPLRVVGG